MPQISIANYIVGKISHTNKILHEHDNSRENLLAHNNMGQHLLTNYFWIAHHIKLNNPFLQMRRLLITCNTTMKCTLTIATMHNF